jgi:hypothetical protein
MEKKKIKEWDDDEEVCPAPRAKTYLYFTIPVDPRLSSSRHGTDTP